MYIAVCWVAAFQDIFAPTFMMDLVWPGSWTRAPKPIETSFIAWRMSDFLCLECFPFFCLYLCILKLHQSKLSCMFHALPCTTTVSCYFIYLPSCYHIFCTAWKTEVASFPETLGTVWCHNPEDHNTCLTQLWCHTLCWVMWHLISAHFLRGIEKYEENDY